MRAQTSDEKIELHREAVNALGRSVDCENLPPSHSSSSFGQKKRSVNRTVSSTDIARHQCNIGQQIFDFQYKSPISSDYPCQGIDVLANELSATPKKKNTIAACASLQSHSKEKITTSEVVANNCGFNQISCEVNPDATHKKHNNYVSASTPKKASVIPDHDEHEYAIPSISGSLVERDGKSEHSGELNRSRDVTPPELCKTPTVDIRQKREYHSSDSSSSGKELYFTPVSRTKKSSITDVVSESPISITHSRQFFAATHESPIVKVLKIDVVKERARNAFHKCVDIYLKTTTKIAKKELKYEQAQGNTSRVEYINSVIQKYPSAAQKMRDELEELIIHYDDDVARKVADLTAELQCEIRRKIAKAKESTKARRRQSISFRTLKITNMNKFNLSDLSVINKRIDNVTRLCGAIKEFYTESNFIEDEEQNANNDFGNVSDGNTTVAAFLATSKEALSLSSHQVVHASYPSAAQTMHGDIMELLVSCDNILSMDGMDIPSTSFKVNSLAHYLIPATSIIEEDKFEQNFAILNKRLENATKLSEAIKNIYKQRMSHDDDLKSLPSLPSAKDAEKPQSSLDDVSTLVEMEEPVSTHSTSFSHPILSVADDVHHDKLSLLDSEFSNMPSQDDDLKSLPSLPSAKDAEKSQSSLERTSQNPDSDPERIPSTGTDSVKAQKGLVLNKLPDDNFVPSPPMVNTDEPVPTAAETVTDTATIAAISLTTSTEVTLSPSHRRIRPPTDISHVVKRTKRLLEEIRKPHAIHLSDQQCQTSLPSTARHNLAVDEKASVNEPVHTIDYPAAASNIRAGPSVIPKLDLGQLSVSVSLPVNEIVETPDPSPIPILEELSPSLAEAAGCHVPDTQNVEEVPLPSVPMLADQPTPSPLLADLPEPSDSARTDGRTSRDASSLGELAAEKPQSSLDRPSQNPDSDPERIPSTGIEREGAKVFTPEQITRRQLCPFTTYGR